MQSCILVEMRTLVVPSREEGRTQHPSQIADDKISQLVLTRISLAQLAKLLSESSEHDFWKVYQIEVITTKYTRRIKVSVITLLQETVAEVRNIFFFTVSLGLLTRGPR